MASQAEMLLGKIVQLSRIGIKQTACARVKCPWNKFHDYTKKYWLESEFFWAFDKKNIIKEGDWVIIKPINPIDAPYKSVKPITHEVEKVVFEGGNLIDPVTKRQVHGQEFADEIAFKRQMILDVIEKPFEEDSLLFEERREIRSQKIKELKENDLSKS